MTAKAPSTMKTCPRCGGRLSRAPAISQTDHRTEICAACSTGEKLERVRTGKIAPKKSWPVAPLR